ncbi:response regulator transcription factor [Croceibacterium salegens]|uniref:response regulator transcription factor n=1 Tax=Croceibacterium salegens TaxID=1737568 RepID=UPI002E2751A1
MLVVEDDREIGAFVRSGLEARGHLVRLVHEGPQAVKEGEAGGFDLLVLDRMLPGMEGTEVLLRLRRAGVDTPVLLLTARGSIEDRVHGLEAGADDYLVKPFALPELLARVEALGRRPRQFDRSSILAAGSIRLDRLSRKVTRKGKDIVLHPREFQILEELMRWAGQSVSRALLWRAIWCYDFDPGTKLVESHVSRLRAKLDFGSAESVIETVRGEGYRLRLDA